MKVAAVVAWLVGSVAVLPEAAHARNSPPKKLILVGTVTAIFQVRAVPPSRRDWGITVHVERVKAGKYTDSTFTFAIHSPARAGLEIGGRYTIEAMWTGQEYEVDETRRIRRERSRP